MGDESNKIDLKKAEEEIGSWWKRRKWEGDKETEEEWENGRGAKAGEGDNENKKIFLGIRSGKLSGCREVTIRN